MNTSPIESTLFKGEDSSIVIDLGETVFSELVDVIVGFRLDNTLVKTMKKTGTGLQEIIAGDDANSCVARIFRSETSTWAIPTNPNISRLIMEVTLVSEDANFPDGFHENQAFYVCDFSPSLISNA